MLRSFLFVLLVFITLYAKGIEEILGYFYSHDYKMSYELLQKGTQDHLDDAKWQFYLGRSAFEIGAYEEALAAFERVEMLEPYNLRVKLEIARTYYRLRSFKEAKRRFEALLKEPSLPVKVKKNIQKYLVVINKFIKKEQKRLYTNLNIGLFYDSNVKNATQVDSYYLPFLNLYVQNATKKKGDWYHQEYLGTSYLLSKKSNKRISLDLLAYFKTFFEEASQNVAFFQLSNRVVWGHSNKLFTLVEYGYNKMFFGSNSYLSTLFMRPSLSYNIDDKNQVGLQFSLGRKFAQTSSLEDSLNILAKFLYNKILSSKDMFGFSIELQKEYTLPKTSIVYQDRRSIRPSVQYFKSFSQNLDGSLEMGGEYSKYDKFDPIFLSKRRDKNFFVILETKKAFKSVVIGVRGGVVKNFSNQAPYQYDKYFIGLNVMKGF